MPSVSPWCRLNNFILELIWRLTWSIWQHQVIIKSILLTLYFKVWMLNLTTLIIELMIDIWVRKLKITMLRSLCKMERKRNTTRNTTRNLKLLRKYLLENTDNFNQKHLDHGSNIQVKRKIGILEVVRCYCLL